VDWFSHILMAVALAIALRRNRTVALAMAFGAMAPDLDILTAPAVAVAPQLWFLDHRTFSHSILLGLPWALLVTWTIQRPAVLGLWRRIFRLDISLPMTRVVLAPMFAGVLLHIGMDALTVQGPALLTPISPLRVQLNLFYYTDILPLAFSSLLIVLYLWQKGNLAQRRAVLVALIVALVVTGVWRGTALSDVRAATSADAAVPTWNPTDWWTWRTLPNGSVEVSLARAGPPGHDVGPPLFSAYFRLLQVQGQGSPPWDISAPRARAESTLDYTSFSMNANLIALNATQEPSGTWRLEYFDPVLMAEYRYSGTSIPFLPGDVVFRVAPDGSVTVGGP